MSASCAILPETFSRRLKNAIEGKSNRPFCMYCDCGSDVRCGGRCGFLKGSSGTVEGGGINGVPPLPWF